jgi:hypothetical protein
MTNRNRFMGALSLIQYCLDNAIHRRFKERSNISSKWIPLTTHDVSLEKSLTPWASTGRSECYSSYHYPEWTQIWYIVVLQHFWSVVSSFYQSIQRYDQDRRRMANLPGNLDRCKFKRMSLTTGIRTLQEEPRQDGDENRAKKMT